MPRVSIIVPTLNEACAIDETLSALSALTGDKEIIVADGGSSDTTVRLAQAAGARVITSAPGRGTQMHAGAMVASAEVLWFVHADTIAPPGALQAIEVALQTPGVVAGVFTLRFSGDSLAARQMTWIYPRLRWLGLSYGDAGIFVRRSVYESAGGFRALPLFEDLDLIRRLKRRGSFVVLDCSLVTSSRRFERRYMRAWAVWIGLQMLYWIGVSPAILARFYRHVR